MVSEERIDIFDTSDVCRSVADMACGTSSYTSRLLRYFVSCNRDTKKAYICENVGKIHI